MTKFRQQIIREHEFHQTYIKMAMLIANLSYCSKRKVGAIIVKDRNIIAYGFNGTVNGMDNVCENEQGKTLPNVVHAEMNAVLKAGTECKGADMYITLFPCEGCTKLMAQAGIKRVYYLEDHKVDNRVELYGMSAIKVDLDQVSEEDLKHLLVQYFETPNDGCSYTGAAEEIHRLYQG